jgi:ABC-type phosphate transport system substrate-binding protein
VVKRAISLLYFLVLAACATTPTTTPTPSLIRVATTSAFEGLVTEWVIEFMDTQNASRIDLRVLALEEALKAVEGGTVDIVITGTQPPRDWFATALAFEGIAVVVHPTNSIRSMNHEDLAALFNGDIDSWSDLGGGELRVQPVIPLPGDETRDHFDAQVLADSGFSPSALLAPSPLAMTAMVTEDKGAIGYLPLSQVTDAVQIVRLEGVLPNATTVLDGRYALRVEILALTTEEPGGATREWLAWLQASLSMDSP